MFEPEDLTPFFRYEFLRLYVSIVNYNCAEALNYTDENGRAWAVGYVINLEHFLRNHIPRFEDRV